MNKDKQIFSVGFGVALTGSLLLHFTTGIYEYLSWVIYTSGLLIMLTKGDLISKEELMETKNFWMNSLQKKRKWTKKRARKIVKKLLIIKRVFWGKMSVRQDVKAQVLQNFWMVIVGVAMGYSIPFIVGFAEVSRIPIYLGGVIVTIMLLSTLKMDKHTVKMLRRRAVANI